MNESFTVGATGHPDWPVDIDITVNERTICLDIKERDAKRFAILLSDQRHHYTINLITKQGVRWVINWLDEYIVRMTGMGWTFDFPIHLAFDLSSEINTVFFSLLTKEEPIKAQVVQSRRDCLDCHGTGKIVLLTSTVKCECQN